MTKVAVWCRHKDDSVVGVGPKIPWHISSDFARFKRITSGQNIVAGQTTYESFPNRTLPNRQIYVLTFDADYEVADKEHHFVVTDFKQFKDFAEDLYICGGASIYKLFMQNMMPEIVVDSVFCGEIDHSLAGEKIDIAPCVEILNKKYVKISEDFEQDNILTAIWVKKGEFIEQSVLKHIINAITIY